MKKIDMPKLGKLLKNNVNKKSPEILMGLGITGMITSTVLAVKATPKALRLLDDAEYETGEQLDKKDMVKLTWKCYIPSTVVGGVSICCLLGSRSVNMRRNAAIATAYTLSETAFKEYQEKVKKMVGDEKDKEIKDSVIKDKLDAIPSNIKDIIITKNGDTMCYDVISGRYFTSSIDTIDKAVNIVNRNMVAYGYVSLNDFYYEIGLTNIKLGDDLGWNIEKGLIEIDYSSHIASNNQPCVVMNYQISPVYEYDYNN